MLNIVVFFLAASFAAVIFEGNKFGAVIFALNLLLLLFINQN